MSRPKHTGKLLLLLLVLFHAACSTLQGEKLNVHGPAVVPVFVVDHGSHTGVVIQRELVKPHLPYISEEFSSSGYIEFGWGDVDFYQSKEKTTRLRSRAAFYPTGAVLHVAGLPVAPVNHYPDLEVRKLLVTESGFRNMLRFVYGTFRRGSDGDPVMTGKGLHVHGLFYHANGKFHLFNTCNSWTAKVPKAGGLPVYSFLTITSDDIME